MELTCFERGNSPSRKYIEARPTDSSNLDEELSLVHSKSYTPCVVHSKSNVRKSDVVSSGDSTDASGSNDHRSITDLPRALVSEILHRLEAKELGIVSCVSTLLNDIASDHHGWKDFYCERWGLPFGSNSYVNSTSPGRKSWKELFVEREHRSKAFMGRYSIDVLHGHTEAVRAVFLLQPAKLIFTGGYDSTIHMWDMEEGLSIALSRPLGCTIRAIAADMGLLVVGGTDAFLQCWKAIEGHPHLFDITGSSMSQISDFRLWGHEGPITCLALDATKIYSGSWDMSVRVWDRARLKCLKTLRHGDWVWALVPRASTLASTAGRDVYIWDTDSGNPTEVIYNAHVGNAYSLARSHSGDLLFTGGEDGAIHMFDVSSYYDDDDDKKPVATWIPHTGPVYCLAFEFPWLVSSSSDGRLALIDIRKLLKSSHRSSKVVKYIASDAVEAPQRMLNGFRPNLFSVDISADRIVCAGEDGVVRVWNFSQALEIEKRVQALRSARLENRMRRRKAQIEMNEKGQCSAAARRNQLNGDRSSVWHNKRGVEGKLKA